MLPQLQLPVTYNIQKNQQSPNSTKYNNEFKSPQSSFQHSHLMTQSFMFPNMQTPPTPPVIENNVDCIIDQLLYIGNEHIACDECALKRLKIKKILNVSNNCEMPFDIYQKLNIDHMHICIKDHSDAPIMDYLDEMLKFIHSAITNNESILVHCKKGRSRSASVVIAYIITYGRPLYEESNASFDDALKFVSMKRQNIQPNLGFCMMLNDLSKKYGFNDSFF